MHYTQLVAVAAAVASFATAAPAADNTGSVGTIHRQDTGRKVLRNGPKAVVKALKKYNVAVPDHVEAAAAATETGTVTATPEQYDSEYLCPVQIGTPAQTLMLDFDTGSSDLWAFSGMLPSNDQTGHSLYRPTKSTSAKKLQGYTWKIEYGDNSMAAGDVYADKVVVGGVTVTSQAVEAATSISAQFASDRNNDGILGLGGPRNNEVSPNPQLTFFRNARPSLKAKQFAAYLKPGTAGAYDFGFANPAHYTGDIHFGATDTSEGFWEITPTAYGVGSSSYGSPGPAIVDTGTSLIFVPDKVLDNYYNQVPSAQYDNSAGGVVFKCSETLPDFSITHGGSVRTVPGSYINYSPLGGGSGYCFGGIQSADGMSFGILGDVFIKSQYVVFNAFRSEVGFADQK